MPKNRSEFGEIAISPLSGQLDLRSPSGRLGIGDFRLLLNASMNEAGKRCRRNGWKKLMSDSGHGFNNQDLHDQLVGSDSHTNFNFPTCVEPPTGCVCPPQSPACVEIQDFTDEMFDDCVAGAISPLPAWNGVIQGTTSCTWGFAYGQSSLNGRELAVMLSFKACPPTVTEDRWVLTVMGKTEDGLSAIIIWQGERSGSVVGTYHRAVGCSSLPTLALANCNACSKPNVTITPPDGAHVTSDTFIFLHAPAGATIYYTTDGGDPDDTSTLYTGPFQLPAGVTVIKAIAYSGDCVSDIAEAEYIIETDFLFQYLCQPGEDEAGQFFEFGPNGNSSDYKWRLRWGFEEVLDVVRLELYETDTSGVWVTGQAWATDNPVFPQELAGVPFAIYPLVIKEGGSPINTQYETTLLEDAASGLHNWNMWGQPFIPLTGFFKLVFIYRDGDGVEQTIYSLISNQCECYEDYGDAGNPYGPEEAYDDYYYCYDGEGGVVSPTSNGIINIDFIRSGAGKTGAAAVGLAGDYWNPYYFPMSLLEQSNDNGRIDNLLWANLDESGATLTFQVDGGNPLATQVWNAQQITFHDDAMMFSAAISVPQDVPTGVVILNVPRGTWDVYVYGHGLLPENICRVFLLTPYRTPNESLRPVQETAVGTGWESNTWVEGQQYVVFRDVTFRANESRDINILFPPQYLDGYTDTQEYYISGIQLVKKA